MRELENKRMRFWYGNVCSAGLVETLVREADYVVHFAAETHVTQNLCWSVSSWSQALHSGWQRRQHHDQNSALAAHAG